MEHFFNQEHFGENWFSFSELYSDMVKKFPCGSKFVEVGCWKGKSSAYMAVEIVNSNKKIEFTCVDIWKEGEGDLYYSPKDIYQTFKNNMLPVENYYKDIRMDSIDASKLFADESLDFVFIDACHQYDCVKNDIIAWKPKIRKGGILAGHDYSEYWPSVKKAVEELLPNNFYTIDTCWIHDVK